MTFIGLLCFFLILFHLVLGMFSWREVFHCCGLYADTCWLLTLLWTSVSMLDIKEICPNILNLEHTENTAFQLKYKKPKKTQKTFTQMRKYSF